ncbi:hypothetical protein FRB95_013439 [Tulasnella sp. JGI-2019a]|nr:hypothetical protein FRB95_013439 [Tulasnella sp. JGI-2019a]
MPSFYRYEFSHVHDWRERVLSHEEHYQAESQQNQQTLVPASAPASAPHTPQVQRALSLALSVYPPWSSAATMATTQDDEEPGPTTDRALIAVAVADRSADLAPVSSAAITHTNPAQAVYSPPIFMQPPSPSPGSLKRQRGESTSPTPARTHSSIPHQLLPRLMRVRSTRYVATGTNMGRYPAVKTRNDEEPLRPTRRVHTTRAPAALLNAISNDPQTTVGPADVRRSTRAKHEMAYAERQAKLVDINTSKKRVDLKANAVKAAVAPKAPNVAAMTMSRQTKKNVAGARIKGRLPCY